MGKFIIKTGKDGQFYFNLKATNGEIILSSEGYTTKTSCKRGIASVQRNAGNSSNYETLVSKNGKPYFNLRAANKQVIGKSELYESSKACSNGIASVKKNAPGAKTEDAK
jgi:uncharacterized protein